MATTRAGERTLLNRAKAPFQRLAQFLREVVLELKRVVWPTREEASAFTVVVVITIVVVAIWMGLLEIVFTSLASLAGLGG